MLLLVELTECRPRPTEKSSFLYLCTLVSCVCDIPHLPAYQDVLLKLKGLTVIGEHLRFGSIPGKTPAMEENFNVKLNKTQKQKRKQNKTKQKCVCVWWADRNSHEDIIETVINNQTIKTLTMSGNILFPCINSEGQTQTPPRLLPV